MKKECPNYDLDWQENEDELNARMNIIGQNGNTGEHYFTCPHCKEGMIWGGDHDYEDYGEEGMGVVSNYSCHNDECSVDTVLIFTTNK